MLYGPEHVELNQRSHLKHQLRVAICMMSMRLQGYRGG